jgi:rhodanese-related sulfurtransferase
MSTRINAAEFIELSKQHNPTIIDIRTHAEIDSESINNCIALPLQELSGAGLSKALDSSETEKQSVYLLCQSGRRADMAVSKLSDFKGPELVIIEGGLNALKEAGITIIKGSKNVISLERQVRIAAGALVLTSVITGLLIHPGLYGIAAFVGAGLMYAGISDNCGMALVLAQMPWNKRKA